MTIAAVPQGLVRRLEYTWAFDAWAARAWNAPDAVVLASAPVFVREAAERLSSLRVLAASPATRAAAAAAGLPLIHESGGAAWGSALWATPGGDWRPHLTLAADRLPPGAPFFVLATARLGWLLGGLRAALAAAEAGAPVLSLAGKLAALDRAGFSVREIVGLRSPASLMATVVIGVAARAGRTDLADRLEQRARASFVATGAAAVWSGMVLIEAVRR